MNRHEGHESKRDTRIERAHQYAVNRIEAENIAERILGHKINRTEKQIRMDSFLAGFDEGMQTAGSGELLEENRYLHGKMQDYQFTSEPERAAAKEMKLALDELKKDPAYTMLSEWLRSAIDLALEHAGT